MLSFKQVSKSYQQHLVINNIDLTITNNKYCLSGANGTGKTTLLMLASGLEKPTTGSIYLKQQAVDLPESKKYIGISSDKVLLPEFLTAKQLITFHCQQYQCDWPETLIKALNFNQQLTTQVSALSLGSQKKLSLLLALSHQPHCLLLDEPTTGLDSTSRNWLLTYLTNYSGLLLITSHESFFTENQNYQQLSINQLNNTNL